MDDRAVLKGVIKAWEKLPEGKYEPRVISRWLLKDMKPAIDRARKAVSATALQETKDGR